jgi:hypothetical protein
METQLSHHLIAESLRQLAVLAADSLGRFPDGVCYSFLVKRF